MWGINAFLRLSFARSLEMWIRVLWSSSCTKFLTSSRTFCKDSCPKNIKPTEILIFLEAVELIPVGNCNNSGLEVPPVLLEYPPTNSPALHGSYKWIIMHEKCGRPDSNEFQLKWRFGTHGNCKKIKSFLYI